MERRELVLPKRPGPARYEDPDLQAFAEFVSFFRAELAHPDVEAGQLDARHLHWFRRLRPLLRMAKGSTILEWGGGSGIDSVFLASRGYSAVYFDLTLGRIEAAEHFANRWRKERGAIEFRSILRDPVGFEPFGRIDAVLLDQVAHHVEPVEGVFAKCATILPAGGWLFLLEPNAWSPITQAHFFRRRRLATTRIRFPSVWNRIARRCGFALESQEHLVPFAAFRDVLETTRGLRALAATDVTSVYRRR